MLRNYIISTIRKFRREKTFLLINIVGLSIGIATFLTLALIVRHELSFDDYHPDADKIYRVVEHDDDGIYFTGRTGYLLAKSLRNEVGDNFTVAQIHYDWGGMIKINRNGIEEKFDESGVIFADTEFSQIFDLHPIIGNLKNALSKPNTAILNETLAIKYYGSVANAIGQVIGYKNKLELKVEAVVRDHPKNTHLPFSIITSYQNFKDFEPDFYDKWRRWAGSTYIKVNHQNDVATIESILYKMKRKLFDEERAAKGDYYLQSLSDIHIDDKYANLSQTTNPKFLFTLFFIGLFVLILACINFVNLATAQSSKRMKEIGVRKVLGSSRLQLGVQFIGESIATTALAALVGITIMQLSTPVIENLLKYDLSQDLTNGGTILIIVGFVLIIGLLTGAYPAFILASFDPKKAIANNHVNSRGKTSVINFRKVLIVGQFVIAMVLVIVTIVIGDQVNYFINKPLGFDREKIVTLPLPENSSNKIEILKNTLSDNSKITNVSVASGTPITWNYHGRHLSLANASTENLYDGELKFVDEDYMDLFGIELIAGRGIKLEDKTSDKIRSFVVNERLIKILGIENPNEALGTMIHMNGGDAPIVGVVKDFHNNSLHLDIAPVALAYQTNPFFQINVQLHSGDIVNTLNFIEESWKSVFPEYIYDQQFFEEYLENNYREESDFGTLTKGASAIAILINCLGLYAMILFFADQRTKEFGIRKTLGASVYNILQILIFEFIRLIGVAMVFGIPLAYWLANNWLSNYSYRIEISYLTLFSGTILILIVTIVTVSYKAYKTAITNPVDSIKYE